MSRVWRGSELALPRSHRDDLPRLGSKAARGPVGPAQRAAAAAPRAWAALDPEGFTLLLLCGSVVDQTIHTWWSVKELKVLESQVL